jgi:hypothetical protein
MTLIFPGAEKRLKKAKGNRQRNVNRDAPNLFLSRQRPYFYFLLGNLSAEDLESGQALRSAWPSPLHPI